ncbi:MAG TPA: SpoIIE family protein phosphatase [Candidatus Akkermansia intestinavium]|nr:SpoIIE family protein phosphatase [Candidatus Akkermansia intestinavium]
MTDDASFHHQQHAAPGVFNWEMVRKALRAAEEGVYCWDMESGEIFYTEQCLRMMGLPFQELAPNIFTESERTIHPEDRQFFRSSVQRYIDMPMAAASPMRVEVRLLNLRSRGWRWIRVNGLLERGEDMKPRRLVGVWVDITRRKMSDMRALEDQNFFRTLINYLPDNIYFKNRESRFVLANEATARKMHVRTPSDLIGCRDSNFFTAAMAEVARAEEVEIMETGIPITNRIHHETWKDGVTHNSWSRVSKFPWYAHDGSIKGIVGISSDVTELIEAQRRYRKLAEQLDQRNRALEKEISLAKEVQRALQPLRLRDRVWQSPADGSTRRATFRHVYMPSTGVAGDCFEVFPVRDSGVGMLICDVMGHGVSAALIAAMLRGLMEQVANLADTPGLLLSSLNRQLYRIFSQAHITMFATACYVYLDLDKQRLTLSGAGHPAPIVMTADGKALLPAIPRSPALGLIESALFRESEIPLEAGMKLMLYTDGLTEAHNPAGDELGAVRIMNYLQERRPINIGEMINISLACMHNFTRSSEQEDDICILGVEFLRE